MATILALYTPPADPARFDQHYEKVHVPLVRQLPGLRSVKISKGPVAVLAGAQTHLACIMEFDTLAAARNALESPQGQAAAADLANFAQAGVTLLMFDTP